jgi:YegS/Rv2252/BmrU family lipid kinase
MKEQVHFIVNPNSGGGSVQRNWTEIAQKIQSKIGKFDYSFTESKGNASEIAERLVQSGMKSLAIIGGDGTVSEVVDGVIRSKSKSVSLLVLNLGTGGDFSKTLGVPGDMNLALDKLFTGTKTNVDAGKILYNDETTGEQKERNFINITGCGMAGAVVRSVNRSSKRFGGFSYYLGSLGNVLSYKNKPIRFRIDGSDWIERKITTLAVCNGQYFGGGMRISPNSSLSDGYLDIVVMKDWNLFQKAYYSKNLYNGTILSAPQVESYRGKRIEIIPELSKEEDSAIIDCDGEDIGKIPMAVEVIPNAVQFLV